MTFDAEMLSRLIYGDGPPGPPSGLILCCPEFMATYEAERQFYGRDWRRRKREVRKALARVKKEQRGKPQGIARDSASWWRGAQTGLADQPES